MNISTIALCCKAAATVDSIIPVSQSASYGEKAQQFFNNIEEKSASIEWLQPSALQAIMLIALIVILFLIYNNPKGFRLMNNTKWLYLMAGAAFISGVILYFIGFNHRGNHNSVALFIYPVIASLEMFLGTNQYVRLADVCKDSAGFMAVYSVTFLTAVSCSLTMLYQLLGFRLGAWARRTAEVVRGWRNKSKKENHYHLFFYPDENSTLLSGRIDKHYNECNKEGVRTRIIYICTPNNTPNNGRGLAKILGLNRNMREEVDKLHLMQISPLIYFCRRDIAELNLSEESETEQTDVLKSIGIATLKRILKNAHKVSIYALSEDDMSNMKVVQNLLQDKTIKACSKRVTNSNCTESTGNKERVNIYFTARRSNYTEIFEDIQQKNEPDIDVRLIDTASLSIESLRQDWRNLPVNFVDIEDAQVTSPFNSLIIGFNHTGQEAFKFLYEFGAFLGTNGEKSPFHCLAIDNNMNNISGSFYKDIPGLKSSSEIELIHCDVNSTIFWETISNHIKTMNYIVIALGDDLLGISLAVDIYKLACRIRHNELYRFKIFVRSYQESTVPQLKFMADHFNRTNKAESKGGEIVIFGDKEHLFTYDNIIQDKLQDNAIEAYEVYRSVAPKEDENKEWYERRKKLLGDNANIFQLQKLKRTEGQDISTSRHIETKLILAGIGAEKASRSEERFIQEKLMGHFLHGLLTLKRENDKMTSEEFDEEEMRFIERLAINEHIRWNASHTLLGYLPNPSGEGCNEIDKTHACITPWEDLRKFTRTDYQLYDYKFIQTAIKLRYEEWYVNKK